METIKSFISEEVGNNEILMMFVCSMKQFNKWGVGGGGGVLLHALAHYHTQTCGMDVQRLTSEQTFGLSNICGSKRSCFCCSGNLLAQITDTARSVH